MEIFDQLIIVRFMVESASRTKHELTIISVDSVSHNKHCSQGQLLVIVVLIVQ